jgi:hypothetical protein
MRRPVGILWKSALTVAAPLLLAGASAELATAATEAQRVPLGRLNGDVAIFHRKRSGGARVVSGRLAVGRSRSPLTASQVRSISQTAVLRVRLSPDAAREAAARAVARATPISLQLRVQAPKTLAPNASAPEKGVAQPSGTSKRKPPPPPPLPPPAPSTGERLYAASSPFNQPIPAAPAIDPQSSAMVQSLVDARERKGFVLSPSRWTVPTYFATSAAPRTIVALRKAPPLWEAGPDFLGYPPGGTNGSTGPLPTALEGVPIPAGAQPDPELDAHMTVIDREANCEYDLYGAYDGSQGWQAVWANSTRLDGNGIYPTGLGVKASGFAGDAGLIWPQEFQTGHIDHALFFAYPFTKSGGPVSPATSSDGRSTAGGAMPEGARVQLDPSLNLDTLGLSPFQRTIAEALQKYGMILGDTGGALSLYAVSRQSFASDPYAGQLPAEDYIDLRKIPVERFRVLALPAQQSSPTLKPQPSGCGVFR